MYSSRQSRWRHKRNDHVIPAKLHKHQFNLKPIKRKTGAGTNSDKRLQKILQNLSQIQEKYGGGTTSNKTLQKILQFSCKYSSEEEKEKDNRANNKKGIKKLLEKMLQSLDEESDVEEEMEKEIEFQEDIENKTFEDVTQEDLGKLLLRELKSCKSLLKREEDGEGD